MKKQHLKFLLLLFIVAAVASFFAWDLQRYLDFTFLKSQKEALANYYSHHQWLTLSLYFFIYVAVTALSLPGAAVLTLMAGAIFGLFTGLVLVSFASSLGATLAFLSARFLLRDSIQNKFAEKLTAINKGMEKEGAFYLLTLRLIPVFPFFIINLVMGLTKISPFRFFLVSQLGMLPGTAVYVNAGTQLAQIDSLQGILSPKLLLSFALLGIFPLAAKKIISFIRSQQK